MFKLIAYLDRWRDLYVASDAPLTVKNFQPEQTQQMGRAGEVIVTRLARDPKPVGERIQTLVLITPADQPLAGLLLHDHLKKQLGKVFDEVVSLPPSQTQDQQKTISDYCDTVASYVPDDASSRRAQRRATVFGTSAILASLLAIGAGITGIFLSMTARDAGASAENARQAAVNAQKAALAAAQQLAAAEARASGSAIDAKKTADAVRVVSGEISKLRNEVIESTDNVKSVSDAIKASAGDMATSKRRLDDMLEGANSTIAAGTTKIENLLKKAETDSQKSLGELVQAWNAAASKKTAELEAFVTTANKTFMTELETTKKQWNTIVAEAKTKVEGGATEIGELAKNAKDAEKSYRADLDKIVQDTKDSTNKQWNSTAAEIGELAKKAKDAEKNYRTDLDKIVQDTKDSANKRAGEIEGIVKRVNEIALEAEAKSTAIQKLISFAAVLAKLPSNLKAVAIQEITVYPTGGSKEVVVPQNQSHAIVIVGDITARKANNGASLERVGRKGGC